ncbi:ATP-binding protein [Flammeovirgaceae bacterium SG7u.111]|nr:ATP-binding protein [Flammeovirgaceae bacterium SG7u.132]WPO35077.1 ATP-binding protein [Flammeovirgaceae bacterium SG7u.111]
MNYQGLTRIISKGESQTLEFKQTITHKYKLAKVICSFANTKGGLLLIGVADNQQILGIDPDEEMYSLVEITKHFCRPEVSFKAQVVEDKNGVSVLVVNILESKEKPHYSLGKKNNWEVYVRMNDKSIAAGKNQVKLMEKAESDDLFQLNDLQFKIVDQLNRQESITVKQCAKLLNLSPRRAKRELIELMQGGVIFQQELKKEEAFFLAVL